MRFVSSFANGGLTDTLLSASGRGYPDISAQSKLFPFIVAGKLVGSYGTSCSAQVRVLCSKDYHVVLFTLCDRLQQASYPS